MVYYSIILAPMIDFEVIKRLLSWKKNSDLVKFVMYNLVSRDCVPFCKYIKRHVHLGNQGTHDKLIVSCFDIHIYKINTDSRVKYIYRVFILLKNQEEIITSPKFVIFLSCRASL